MRYWRKRERKREQNLAKSKDNAKGKSGGQKNVKTLIFIHAVRANRAEKKTMQKKPETDTCEPLSRKGQPARGYHCSARNRADSTVPPTKNSYRNWKKERFMQEMRALQRAG